MKTQVELLTVEGGSVFIVRVVKGESAHSDRLIAEQLDRYIYAAKPYAATVIDITWGGYFISSSDLAAMGMSLPAGATERTACAVVATENYAPQLQKLLATTHMTAFIRVFTSLDEGLHTVKMGVAKCARGLPALFVQSSRAVPSSPAGRAAPTAAPLPVPQAPASDVFSSPEITRPKVFLAHASEDKEAIRRLHRQLMDSGFQPWLDELDLIPGKNWRTAITEAIARCDVFLACLSKSSVGKQGYVQRELRMALSVYSERPPGTMYLIPVRLDDCDVPDLQMPEIGMRLRDIHWLDLWKTDGFEALVNAIWAATATATPERQSRASVRPGVRIVDISFVERNREQADRWPIYLEHTGDNVQLDVKVRNVSSEVAFIKRLNVSVEQLWELEGFGFAGAAVPVSAEYDIAIPIKSPPFGVDMPIAHSLEANGVDRFVVTLHLERGGYLFLVRIGVIYDEDDKSVVSERILFATRPNACTWPTASAEMLAETDGIAAEGRPGTMWDRWRVARRRIENNNRIRDEISRISGLRNRAVASFETGEPLVQGF
jgi:hypothetical protein